MQRIAAGVIAFAGLVSCQSGPTPAEIQTMQSALKPSSQATAEVAVKAYFDGVLIDAPSARWKFPLPPTRGAFVPRIGSAREFGWFLCGEVNAKNRMGGYTGYYTFFAHFSPTRRDVVIDGTTDDGTSDLHIVPEWCKQIYAQGASG